MTHRLLSSVRSIALDRQGITGLETAIILIAFVVVASVFSYTILSAGIFTADQSKEATYAGLKHAQNSMELIGSTTATGVVATAISNVETPGAWVAATDVTRATELFDRKQGNSSIDLSIAVGFATGIIAHENLITTVDLTSHYAAGLWIKADTAVADGVLQLLLDDSANCGSPEKSLNISALTANTWQQLNTNLSDRTALGAVACTGLFAVSDPGTVVLTIDQIEGPGELQKVHFTVAATLDSSDIALTITTDSDGNGLLSDESPKNHTMVVSYLDEDQLIHDLTWTKSALGRDDGDVALEPGEKVELTVELQGVNPIPIARTAMTIMLRPVLGAAITIEKRAPNNIATTMTLD